MGQCRQEGAPFDAIVRWEGIEAVPVSPTYCTAGSAAPAHQKDVWCKSSTCKPTQYLPTPWWSRKEIHSRGHGGISLSCASCWFDDAHHTLRICIWTSGTCRKDDAEMPAIFRIHSITRRHNCHLPSKQYETRNTQQCIVPNWNQGPKQSQRPHAHGRHGGHPHQQWSGTQYFADNRSSDVIGRRGQTGCIVHQRQNSGLNAMYTQWNGTPANSHPHPNQQFDCPCTTHQQNSAQGVEGHGHAIPLVALPQSTGPVSILLETWNTKFGRLPDQASSSQSPQGFLATNLNVILTWPWEHQIQYSKEHGNQVLCQEHSINTIICGTIGSKTKNICSQRRLIAQYQGCVRLAVSRSWGKDMYSQVSSLKDIYLRPRPSPFGNRIPHNTIPAKAHSIVL